MPEPNLTPELLVERGYRRHTKVRDRQWLNNADELFQKKIDGKYVINIFRYWHSDRDGWQPEVQFSTHGCQSPTFGVTLIGNLSLDDIEAFFARMYERMECKPYDD